jgi:2-octaprenylphenol hydroxylase
VKQKHDIVIAGAGMVGLAAAALLDRNDRLDVTVVDAGPEPDFDTGAEFGLRVSSIAPGSIGILEQAGAWQDIVGARACPFRAMKVWDAAGNVDGPETLSFAAAEFGLGELGYIVENELIRTALVHRLQDSGVTLCFDTPIDTVTRAGHRFRLSTAAGEALSPDLLVAADGARSMVRDSAGIAVDTWAHEQKALVTMLRTETGHRDTAWQRFLDTGPIGMLPLADGRISIVWSTTPGEADDALGMTDEALSDKLTEVSDGALGRLDVAGPRGVFPLVSQHARHYVQDGVVLVGDAAHSIHPLAGQGVNLGFADAGTLAEIIGEAVEREENPGDLPVLRRYERARKGANRTMLHFMDFLNRLFSNESRPLARLRGTGMFLFNKSGPVRNHAVHTALGLH